MPFWGKWGDEEFEQEEVGGECRSLEVLYSVVAGHGSEKGEEEKVQHMPATTRGSSSQEEGGELLRAKSTLRSPEELLSNLSCRGCVWPFRKYLYRIPIMCMILFHL